MVSSTRLFELVRSIPVFFTFLFFISRETF
jgi:hypothetical protein